MIDFEQIKKRYEQIQTALQKKEFFSNWEKRGKLEKEKRIIEEILQKKEELNRFKQKIDENNKIRATEKDKAIIKLAEEENKSLQAKINQTDQQINILLARIDKNKQETSAFQSVIMEIRAGTGGEEAALFAADLFNMYSKYASAKNWTVKVLDSHRTDLGGFKEIIFEIKGKGAFSKLKYEGGVHRVQRIPKTEKSGRIHTSTASVAVLPKPKKAQIEINPDDLKIDTFRASGPGGQNVNRRETAIRITHLPSGIVVSSQTERNQLQNKENALAILEARLLQKKEEEKEKTIGSQRKTQIGRAKRAEKIRTYNFPQNRVTDHRIKKTWHNLEAIMSGELEPIIEKLTREN